MRKFFTSVMGLFSGQNVGKVIDVAKEKVEDVDKRNEIIGEILKAEAGKQTIPLLDGIHKLGRQILIGSVIYFHVYCKLNEIVLSLEEMTFMYAAVGVYTFLKGKGR